MPTFYPPGRRKGNRFYTVRGRIGGREYEITTRAADKDGAEDAWSEFRIAIRQRDHAAQPASLTFDTAARRYEAARDLSPNDARYVRKLRDHFAGRLLATITMDDLNAAAAALYPAALPQTRNRQALAPAAAILHYEADNKLVDWLRVKKLAEVEPERPVAFTEDAERIIARATGPLRVLVMTLAYQGWRITETITIERAKCDFAAARVLRWVAKSRKWRWAAVDPQVNRAWRRLPVNPDGRLFPYRDRWQVYDALAPITKALGIHYTPHMSRRGFATGLIQEHVDLKSVMDAGGWLDIKSVLAYATADVDHDRATLAKLRARKRGAIRGKHKKQRKING